MKNIEVKGRFTETKQRPATLNLPARAEKCLDHMLENVDRQHNFVPYVGATLGDEPPHFAHHRLDWTEVLPYVVYGMPIIRNMTGSTKGFDIQMAQRRLTLAHFTNLDGMVHAPVSPWNDAYPLCIWEQARTLYVLMYWYWDSREARVLAYADGIVDGLFDLSFASGRERTFPAEIIRTAGMGTYAPGTLIDPLVRYHEMTGNGKALQLAEGLTHMMLNPRNGYFTEEGHHQGHSFRTVVAVVNGLSHFASFKGEPGLLEKARQIHDHMISLCTAFGATPCNEPACSDMELNMSALYLIRAGFDEYWDQMDRFVRNQIVECQFLDPSEHVPEKGMHGKRMDKSKWVTEFWPDDLHLLPYDDYHDVVNRSVGGFMFTSAEEHLFIPASLMLCCAAHAMRSFEIVWENALTEDIGGVTVNFHYNHENDLGEIISWEPYEGKVAVILKRIARLRVRIPEYALAGPLQATVDGTACEIAISGRYADFGIVPANATCMLAFPLNIRTTVETYVQQDYPERNGTFNVKWRGNTVISLDPASREEKAIFKRSVLDTDAAPYADVRYFLPDNPFRW